MNLEGVEKAVIEWHSSTFPNATNEAILEKFKEELREFLIEFCKHGELSNVFVIEEFADLCIVFMVGMSKIDRTLSESILTKLEVNKLRIWGTETSNGDRPRVK